MVLLLLSLVCFIDDDDNAAAVVVFITVVVVDDDDDDDDDDDAVFHWNLGRLSSIFNNLLLNDSTFFADDDSDMTNSSTDARAVSFAYSIYDENS